MTYLRSYPTNVISPLPTVRVFLETDLFKRGYSAQLLTPVSRYRGLVVQRKTKIIKKLGGGIRLALAQYRELAAFAQFASDLDEATRAQLEHGQRVTELMKQNQYAPMSVANMAVSIFAAEKMVS